MSKKNKRLNASIKAHERLSNYWSRRDSREGLAKKRYHQDVALEQHACKRILTKAEKEQIFKENCRHYLYYPKKS